MTSPYDLPPTRIGLGALLESKELAKRSFLDYRRFIQNHYDARSRDIGCTQPLLALPRRPGFSLYRLAPSSQLLGLPKTRLHRQGFTGIHQLILPIRCSDQSRDIDQPPTNIHHQEDPFNRHCSY